MLRRLNNPGEKDGPCECDDGEHDERERPDTTDVAESVGRFRGRCGRRIAKISFTYPGCAIEEKREPTWLMLEQKDNPVFRSVISTYPGPKLNPTDGLNSIRQMGRCSQDLADHLERPRLDVGVPNMHKFARFGW